VSASSLACGDTRTSLRSGVCVRASSNGAYEARSCRPQQHCNHSGYDKEHHVEHCSINRVSSGHCNQCRNQRGGKTARSESCACDNSASQLSACNLSHPSLLRNPGISQGHRAVKPRPPTCQSLLGLQRAQAATYPHIARRFQGDDRDVDKESVGC